MSDDLSSFLLARIAEDERGAQAANHVDGATWADVASDNWQTTAGHALDHVVRYSPARVLAECQAKKRIVAEHEMSPFPTLALLALPYIDHPDFQERWRP